MLLLIPINCGVLQASVAACDGETRRAFLRPRACQTSTGPTSRVTACNGPTSRVRHSGPCGRSPIISLGLQPGIISVGRVPRFAQKRDKGGGLRSEDGATARRGYHWLAVWHEIDYDDRRVVVHVRMFSDLKIFALGYNVATDKSETRVTVRTQQPRRALQARYNLVACGTCVSSPPVLG